MKLEITAQEAFDIALNGVLKQGRRSYDCVANECLYNDENGAHCAVGHIVAQKLPGVVLPEGIGSNSALRRVGIEIEPDIGAMISDLQGIHDAEAWFGYPEEEDSEVDMDHKNRVYIDHFKDKMRVFANENNLEYKEA